MKVKVSHINDLKNCEMKQVYFDGGKALLSKINDKCVFIAN